jgi:hypothetical protein
MLSIVLILKNVYLIYTFVFVVGYAVVSQLCYHIILFQISNAVLPNTGYHSAKKFVEMISL